MRFSRVRMSMSQGMEDAPSDKERSLLRQLCRSLDTEREKDQKSAQEWQNFGRFTAAVLQKEVETFARKLRVLEERLQRLTQENSELQETCLYLDKFREETEEAYSGRHSRGKLKAASEGDPTGARPLVHSICTKEMNADESALVQYDGLTSKNTLKDKRRNKFSLLDVEDPKVAVVELQKRIEKLESEKLELVKSLSAAHLLTAHNTRSMRGTAKDDSASIPSPVEKSVLSPEFQCLLESCREEHVQDTTAPSTTIAKTNLNVSPDMIMQAVTLMDMCRRLDALEANGIADPLEAAEVSTLRLLMSIGWQKLQEESKKPDTGSNQN